MTANLTCAMGDVRRVSKGATAYCKDHPGSAVAPLYATGHATIYTFACVGVEDRALHVVEHSTARLEACATRKVSIPRQSRGL